jgi:serine/threonine protein kinase/formylglycine-generating enzyme required for sulfatase activity
VSGHDHRDPADPPRTLVHRAEGTCDRFEAAWKGGERPRIEDYLADVPEPERPDLLHDLILLEIDYRRLAGDPPRPEEYLARFPALNRAWIVRELSQAAPSALSVAEDSAPDTFVSQSISEDDLAGPPPDVPGYKILEELGRGGMGVVYKARHKRLNRLVALKMVLIGAHAGAEQRVRFLAEGEVIAQLQHPHIVPIYEIGQHAGLPYFALEYQEGGSLDSKLQGAPLPPPTAARLLELLARAIHAAHQRGIIHRDLKPANVLLVRSERPEAVLLGNDVSGRATYEPKITDFGLAKRLTSTVTPSSGEGWEAGLTESGAIVGTPSYMAPEQAGGRIREVGPPADIYALGALLYELLTGRPPFKAPTVHETLTQVLSQEPVPPAQLQPQVPRDLETICLKCLQKDPAKRYASALALAEDLHRFQLGHPIHARSVTALERGWRWCRRNPVVAGLLVVVIGMAATALTGILWGYGAAVRERNRARSAEAQAQAERDAALEANRRRVRTQVEQLGTASPQAIPALLTALEEEREAILPQVRQLWADPHADRRRRMRAGLGLLPADPGAVRDELAAWLLEADDPAEVLLVRNALVPYRQDLRERFWAAAEEERPDRRDARFRALVSLAAFDPDGDRWAALAPAATEQLLSANALHLGTWVEGLRPVRVALMEPLGKWFRTAPSPEQRKTAAQVLADYADDQPENLARLLADADERQFAVLFPRLRAHDSAADLLERQLREQAGTKAHEVAWARRQATVAAALLRLGRPEQVWSMLRHSENLTRRSYLVQRFAPLGVEARLLVERLEAEPDVTARRALILALGDYGRDTELFPEALRQRLVPRLLDWYHSDPDPGVHSAIDWLLRHGREGPQPRALDWGQAAALEAIDWDLGPRRMCELAVGMVGGTPQQPLQCLAGLALSATGELAGPRDAGRRWYVNGQGQTLVRLNGPVAFDMGSPDDEPGHYAHEARHRRQISRNFALATKPVTVAQWRRFLRAHPEVRHYYTHKWSPDPNGPIITVTWYQAAQYCRWLSEQEGIPEDQMCYPPVEEIETCQKGGRPLKLPADFLARTGYRLPTEAEWEYACRAQSRTARYYGSGVELLGRYAWYLQNALDRTWPVGQKRPNDFGFFDLHGNVWNWCQTIASPYPTTIFWPAEDKDENREITDKANRVLRGGAGDMRPEFVRSAYRGQNAPAYSVIAVGLRPARTLR